MDSTVFGELSDQALIGEVKRLAAHERQATAALVASLAEFDARRLYLGEGCPSLFAYCTQVLALSEHAAYHRIEAARTARRFPLVLERLRAGDLTLTAVGLLSAHLTADNCRDVLDEARHRSKREVEEIVARLRPRPDVPASLRKVPEKRGDAKQVCLDAPPSLSLTRADDRTTPGAGTVNISLAPPAPPARPAVVRPLAPARYYLQVTVSLDTRDKLREAQQLLRHAVPSGDPAVILDRALTLLVAELRRTRLKKTKRPPKARPERRAPECSEEAPPPTATAAVTGRSGLVPDSATPAPTRSRHVPAAVVRAVWQRDGGQCGFVGTEGRCRERSFLEVHHRIPFADGGPSTVANLELRCCAHNRYEAAVHVAQAGTSGAFDDENVWSPAGTDPTRSGPS